MFNGRRQPSCDGTSRMTRECQVRICERLGVKFPGPTRQKQTSRRFAAMSALPPKADIRFCARARSQEQGRNHRTRSVIDVEALIG